MHFKDINSSIAARFRESPFSTIYFMLFGIICFVLAFTSRDIAHSFAIVPIMSAIWISLALQVALLLISLFRIGKEDNRFRDYLKVTSTYVIFMLMALPVYMRFITHEDFSSTSLLISFGLIIVSAVQILMLALPHGFRDGFAAFRNNVFENGVLSGWKGAIMLCIIFWFFTYSGPVFALFLVLMVFSIVFSIIYFIYTRFSKPASNNAPKLTKMFKIFIMTMLAAGITLVAMIYLPGILGLDSGSNLEAQKFFDIYDGYLTLVYIGLGITYFYIALSKKISAENLADRLRRSHG